MDKKNTIKVYTTSSGAELNISAPSTKQVISATNNRAQYFAEQAKKYRDEARTHRDNAKYYAEQNSDVTFEYIDKIRASLEDKISTKQNVGDYALKKEIPENVSELINDAEYVNKTELDEVRLPSQEGCAGRVLMSDGENESWVGISTFQLFDTVLKDHILTYEESKGWALQGTYVYKEAVAGSRYGYPDFYAKCLEEYNEFTDTETVNGVVVKVHSNGHKFFDITDKASIDRVYNSNGMAWYYGIDTENERILLPRDKYFAVKGRVSVAGNGMTLGLTDGTTEYGLSTYSASNIGSGVNITYTGFSGKKMPYNNTSWGNPATASSALGISKNSAKSGIEGKLEANEDKYLYICVGNTEVESVITDVVDVTTTDNDTIPLFTALYFDFTPNNMGWLKAGEQANSGGIYTTCYNELVNELTNPKYDLKVIETSAMQSDADYSEYWKVNKENMTFATPTAINVAEQSTVQLYFKVANAVENLELLDVGEVMESLSDKIGRQDCKAYITETYVNGASGYNIYSNGYCEQWGEVRLTSSPITITLLKTYANTKYNITTSITANKSGQGYVETIDNANKTNSAFKIYCVSYGSAYNSTIYFKTAGYLS